MAKVKKNFSCQECGFISSKWLGRCPDCGSWNCFKETDYVSSINSVSHTEASFVQLLDEIIIEQSQRLLLNFSEMDRVLGGGAVKSSVILVGGEPGIGKSTLLLQVCEKISSLGEKVLYVSGEESLAQIKMRSQRLSIQGFNIKITNEIITDHLKVLLAKEKPTYLIIDSIQTLQSSQVDSLAGSPSQLKFTTLEIINWCKVHQITLFLIGHVTKEGFLAGPKTVEHMVDTVLYFDQGESELRILRATKNRFGPIDEIGFFLIEEKGLFSLEDTENYLYSHTERELPIDVSLACLHEGSRSFIVEIQALTVPASGGLGRVYSDRVDSKRISRLCAVLEKQVNIKFSDQDVYVNVLGGLRLSDVGADLALLVALYSARTSIVLPKKTVFWGEVSLSGDIRPVAYMKSRLKASKESKMKNLISPTQRKNEDATYLKQVISVQEVIHWILEHFK